jgi:hypothetical protein
LNRHIYVLVIPKFEGSTIDLEKVAVHWAAMTTPSIQYDNSWLQKAETPITRRRRHY